MSTRTLLLSVLGLGLAAAPTTAQVGEPLPEIEFEAFGNTEAGSIDDFRGRLILLEVFAYW